MSRLTEDWDGLINVLHNKREGGGGTLGTLILNFAKENKSPVIVTILSILVLFTSSHKYFSSNIFLLIIQ